MIPAPDVNIQTYLLTHLQLTFLDPRRIVLYITTASNHFLVGPSFFIRRHTRSQSIYRTSALVAMPTYSNDVKGLDSWCRVQRSFLNADVSWQTMLLLKFRTKSQKKTGSVNRWCILPDGRRLQIRDPDISPEHIPPPGHISGHFPLSVNSPSHFTRYRTFPPFHYHVPSANLQYKAVYR